MLRIISGLLLLIISRIIFASVSTSNSIVAATSTGSFKTATSSSGIYGVGSTALIACQDFAAKRCSTDGYCVTITSASAGQCYRTGGVVVTYSAVTTYSCSSGVLSDSSGNPSSSGQYCKITTTTDSCISYAGQSGYFWVSYRQAPAIVCSGTCTATVGSHGDAPEYPYDRYVSVKYTYTGETGSCTSDSGFVDSSAAATANASADSKDLADKIQKAIDDAITACGGIGHYTSGTFNGQTQIVCTNQDSITNKTETTTTTSGSTTTDTTSTTTNNTGKTTTVNPDGTSSTTGGSSNTSGSTTSTSTRTNPDGSTTTTTATSGATGTCDQSDMKGTAGCAQMGEIPDVPDLPTDTVDAGSFTERAPFSDSGQCPADIVITSTLKVSFLPLCNASSMIRPVLLTIAWLVAAYIMRGRNMKEDD